MFIKKALFFLLFSTPAYAGTTIFSSKSNCHARSDGYFNQCKKSEVRRVDEIAIIDGILPGLISFKTDFAIKALCSFKSPKIMLNDEIIFPGGSQADQLIKVSIDTKTATIRKDFVVEPYSLSDVLKSDCAYSIESEVSLPNLTPLKAHIEETTQDLTLVELAMGALEAAEGNATSKSILKLAKASLDASLTSFIPVMEDLEAKLTSTTEADARGEIEMQKAELTSTVASIEESLRQMEACTTNSACTPDFSAAKNALVTRKERARSSLKAIKAFLQAEDARLVGIEESIRLQIQDLLAKPEMKEIASQ